MLFLFFKTVSIVTGAVPCQPEKSTINVQGNMFTIDMLRIVEGFEKLRQDIADSFSCQNHFVQVDDKWSLLGSVSPLVTYTQFCCEIQDRRMINSEKRSR